MIKVMGLEELRPQPPNYNPQGLTRNAAANSSLDVQPPELWRDGELLTFQPASL